MGRPRRFITEEGYLRCTGCEEWKHITAYYCSGGPYYCVVEDGIDVWYSKPMSRCIACARQMAPKTKRQIKTEEQEEWDKLEAEMKLRGIRIYKDKHGTIIGIPYQDEL